MRRRGNARESESGLSAVTALCLEYQFAFGMSSRSHDLLWQALAERPIWVVEQSFEIRLGDDRLRGYAKALSSISNDWAQPEADTPR